MALASFGASDGTIQQTNRGMILSEGAGAIVLARGRPITIDYIHPGGYYRKASEAEQALNRILRDLSQTEINLVISSANGTFIDQAEQGALGRWSRMQ